MLLFTVSVETVIPEMDKYSFPSTQNTMNILVYFSLLTAFHLQCYYKDNRNSCSWSLKSSTKSRVQKWEMFKAKSDTKTSHVSLLKHQFLETETKARITIYTIYITLEAVFIHYIGLLSPTS